MPQNYSVNKTTLLKNWLVDQSKYVPNWLSKQKTTLSPKQSNTTNSPWLVDKINSLPSTLYSNKSLNNQKENSISSVFKSKKWNQISSILGLKDLKDLKSTEWIVEKNENENENDSVIDSVVEDKNKKPQVWKMIEHMMKMQNYLDKYKVSSGGSNKCDDLKKCIYSKLEKKFGGDSNSVYKILAKHANDKYKNESKYDKLKYMNMYADKIDF